MEEMLAITIQNTIAKLGPFPDETGDPIKKILGGDDWAASMALGMALEKCCENNNFEELHRQLQFIKNKSPLFKNPPTDNEKER